MWRICREFKLHRRTCRYDVPIYVTATRNISTYNIVWFVPPIFIRLTFFSFRKPIRFTRVCTSRSRLTREKTKIVSLSVVQNIYLTFSGRAILGIYIYIFEGKHGSWSSGLARFLACVSDRSIDHRRSVIRRKLKKKKKICAQKGRRNVHIYNRDAIISRDHAWILPGE